MPIYVDVLNLILFFFSSRRRHTRWTGDWSSDVCSSDLAEAMEDPLQAVHGAPPDAEVGEDLLVVSRDDVLVVEAEDSLHAVELVVERREQSLDALHAREFRLQFRAEARQERLNDRQFGGGLVIRELRRQRLEEREQRSRGFECGLDELVETGVRAGE